MGLWFKSRSGKSGKSPSPALTANMARRQLAAAKRDMALLQSKLRDVGRVSMEGEEKRVLNFSKGIVQDINVWANEAVVAEATDALAWATHKVQGYLDYLSAANAENGVLRERLSRLPKLSDPFARCRHARLALRFALQSVRALLDCGTVTLHCAVHAGVSEAQNDPEGRSSRSHHRLGARYTL